MSNISTILLWKLFFKFHNYQTSFYYHAVVMTILVLDFSQDGQMSELN